MPESKYPSPEVLIEDRFLSQPQRDFFNCIQAIFPGIIPREISEDGTITFHGLGRVRRIDLSGEVQVTDELAPACPYCADEIMREIDAGYEVAECHYCGNAVRDISGGSNE